MGGADHMFMRNIFVRTKVEDKHYKNTESLWLLESFLILISPRSIETYRPQSCELSTVKPMHSRLATQCLNLFEEQAADHMFTIPRF